MKIGEILKLLESDIVANIAKREDIHLSEKPLRNALKSAGYEFRNSGNKGWYYIGEQDEAEIKTKTIYDFAPARGTRGRTKATVSTSIKNSTQESKGESVNNSKNLETSQQIASTSENESNSTIESNTKATSKNKSKSESKPESKRNKKPDAIDLLLMQNEDSDNGRTYRGFYWDRDIIEFLDSIKHGNKSDLMNEIVRTVLKAKGLI